MADMDEETKDNIIAGVQKIFPDVTDLSFFRIIFNSYDWDMEIGLQAIKTLLEDRNTRTVDTVDNKTVVDNNNDMWIGNSEHQRTSGSQIVPLPLSRDGTYAGRLGAIPKSGSSSDGGKKSVRNKKREKFVSTYVEVAKLRNPIERIAKYTEAGVKVMVIMRGCPGSGKTFLVQQLATNLASMVPDSLDTVDHHIFSADDFWINPTTGKYLFNAEYLEYAHLWNQKLVRQASLEGRSPIFVDNTHTRMWEMKTVASIAVEYGYVVEILEPPTKWAFSEAELVKRNGHGVHREAIRRMLERYEHGIKPKHVLTQYNLNYLPNLEPPQRWTVSFDTPASKAQNKIFNVRFHCASLDLILALKPGPVDDAPPAIRKKTVEGVSSARKDVQKSHSSLDLLSGDHQQLDDPMKSLVQPVLVPDKLSENKLSKLGYGIPTNETFRNNRKLIFDSEDESMEFDQVRNELTPSPAFEVRDDEPMAKLSSVGDIHTAKSPQREKSRTPTETFEKINPIAEKNSESCDEYGNPILSEYVVVKPDGELMFQKVHNSLSMLNLKEFIANGSRAKIKKNVVESSSNRLAAVFSKLKPLCNLGNDTTKGEPNLANNVSLYSQESSEDYDLGPISTNSWGIKNPTNADVTSDNGVSNTLATWTENTSSSIPSPVRSDSPKEQRFLPIRLPQFIPLNDASCNTNFEDFNNLSKANAGLLHGHNIITAYANRFKSATTLPKFNVVKVIATHDKSSMTHTDNPVVDTDSGVQLLAKMFPGASVECIEELLEKCHNDVDWTASLILDSGLEICENFVATDNLKFSTRPPNEETSTPKPMIVDNSVGHTSSKKPKKNKIAGMEEYVRMARELEGNFVLGDDHYSERLKKVRETKFGIQTSSSSQAQNAIEIDSDDSDEMPCGSPTISSDSQVSDVEDDDKMDLIVSKHFISQLSDQFGSVPNLFGNELILKLPVNLARQLYSYALDAICLQMEEEQNAINKLIKEDEQYARQLQDLGRQDSCSFQEILDHEFALRAHEREQEQSTNKPTIAGKLSLRLLADRFPNMDPTTLCKVLADTNQSLSEATNLLSLAGHDPVVNPPMPSTRDESPETYHDADYEMTRTECIRQANAYHEVAEKLNETKKEYYNKARMYHDSGNHAVAQFYSEMFAWYTERIKESNVMAARSMLLGNEKATTLDLHFLNVPDAIRVFDLFIDESIRRLNTRKREIFIITGRGLHSLNGRSKIKPAIILRLRQRGLKYSEINPGMLKTAITKSSCESYQLLN